MGRAGFCTLTGCLVLALCGTAAGTPVVTYRSTVEGPAVGMPDVCRDQRSPSTPQLMVDPSDPSRVTVVYLEDGGDVITAARSETAGADWAREAIGPALSCTGGPEQRAWAINPTLALAGDGAPMLGNSWGRDGALDRDFGFGVVAHRRDAEGWGSSAVDGGYAQNLALAAGADGRVHALWDYFEQIPNRLTYAPVRTELRFATSSDGGRTFGAPTAVGAGLPGFIFDNARLVTNPDGSLLAVVASAFYGYLPVTVIGGPVPFDLLAARSDDGGQTWTQPTKIGTAQQFFPADPRSRRPAADRRLGA